MRAFLLLLVCLWSVNAEVYRRTVEFELTVNGVTDDNTLSSVSDDIKQALAGEVGVTTGEVDLSFGTAVDVVISEIVGSVSVDDLETAVDGDSFIANLNAATTTANIVGSTSATQSNKLMIADNNSLPNTCTEGTFLVDGTNTAPAVILANTETDESSITRVDGETVLTLDLVVPTRFFTEENFAVTFHNQADNNVQDGCFTTKDNYDQCDNTNGFSRWNHADDSNGECWQRLTGQLPWNSMMLQHWADQDRIYVEEKTVYDVTVGESTVKAWQIFFAADIEVWNQITTTGDLADANNDLEITANRKTAYTLTFWVEWPQTIEILATVSRNFAKLVMLYAVVDVQQVETTRFNLDWDTTDTFGEVLVTVKTHVQHPFVLRGPEDAETNLRPTITGPNAYTTSWHTPYTTSEVCNDTDDPDECVQEWKVMIIPENCDVSGTYTADFYAVCYGTSPCPLDDLDTTEAEEANRRKSNSWTGFVTFDIQSQSFCPVLLDTITVDGIITMHTDNNFDDNGAISDSNPIYSNDHLYARARFHTTSEKDEQGRPLDHADLIEHDSLIEFVRPTSINTQVSLDSAPLQWVVDNSKGDVIYYDTNDELNYEIVQCNATSLSYPYHALTIESRHDCFLPANVADKTNSGLMDFNEVAGDDNEIHWHLRLDERSIPIDAANVVADITLWVDVEVYYVGDYSNPQVTTRRRLRRTLQGNDVPLNQRRFKVASPTFPVAARPADYKSECLENAGESTYGFKITTEYAAEDVPNQDEGARFQLDTKYSIVREQGLDWDDITIHKIRTCSEDDVCVTIFPATEEEVRGVEMKYVHFYMDFNALPVYQTFEDQMSSLEVFRRVTVIKSESVSCSRELQTEFENMRAEGARDSSGVWSFSITLVMVFLVSLL